MTPIQRWHAMIHKHHREYNHLPDAAKQAVDDLTNVIMEWNWFEMIIYTLMTITDEDIENLPSKKKDGDCSVM